jgi:hypothetical protein
MLGRIQQQQGTVTQQFLLAVDHHQRPISHHVYARFHIKQCSSQLAMLHLVAPPRHCPNQRCNSCIQQQQAPQPQLKTINACPHPSCSCCPASFPFVLFDSCSAQKQQVSMQVTAGLTAAAATQMLMPLAAAAEVTPSLK